MKERIMPVIANDTVVMAMLATLKLRSRNGPSGTSGSAGVRPCHQTNTMSTRTPRTSSPGTVMKAQMVPQLKVSASECEHRAEQADGAEDDAGDVEGVRVDVELRDEPATEQEGHEADGDVDGEDQRQSRVSMRMPPRMGPTRVAMPAVAPHRAIAPPRRVAGKMRVITAMVCGVISEAPRPCTRRGRRRARGAADEAAGERGEGENDEPGR